MKRYLFILFVALLFVNQSFPSNRYWVGGSGKWSNAGHWSDMENGPGGATVPTVADDVFIGFNYSDSHNFIVQIDTIASCASLQLKSKNLIITGEQQQSIYIHGSLEVKEIFTDQMEGSWIFASAQDDNRITNPGSFTGNLVFDGSGTWDIAFDITAKNISLVSGSLNTNGFAVNCGFFDLSGSKKRSLHLGSSVVNLNTWNASLAENLIFEAGTSELIFHNKIDPYTLNFNNLKYNKISSSNNSKAKPVFNMFVSNPNCHDDLGSILVQITSGTPGYIYYLIGDAIQQYPAVGTTLETVHVFNNLLSNKKYLVLVVDLADSDVRQDTMINPPAINVSSIDLTHISTCPGDATGQIVVNATGGTGSLDYSIDNGAIYQLSNTFNELTADVYPVRVRDDNNCETPASNQTITEPARTIFSNVVIDSIDCRDDDNATITVTAANAQRTFELSIGGAYQVSNVFNPVGDGSYTLTARDQNGCIASYGSNPVVVPNPPALSATFTTDSINCNGGNDGSITIIPSGGTAPYQYSITGAAPYSANATFPNLGLGAYTVAVQDFHGCTAQAIAQANIYEPAPMTKVTDSQTNITCRNANDGQIILEATGGTKPYTFSIPSKPNIVTGGTATFTNLGQGQYTATVTDANSCPSSIIWVKHTFANPTAVTFSHVKTNETPCNNSDNGTITITAAGGTGNGYTYTINNGTSWENNGGIYTNLTAGNYQVNVRDANLCEATMVLVQITQPSALGMSLTSTSETDCSYSNDGTIIITGTGGTPPLQYSINNGTNWFSNDGNFTSVQAGNYIAIVKDNNNCLSISQAVAITQPDSLFISNVVAINENPCNSSNNGSISITATGGDGTYFYTFDNEGSYGAANNASGLIAASYTIRVQDGKGCFSDKQVVPITEPSVVNFTFTKTNCTCFGLNNGTITINPTGGTGAGYEYSLDGAGWLPIVNPISGIGPLPSPHNLKVRDAAGCESVTKQVTITQPNKVNFAAVKTDETPCFNSNNGTITIQTVTGGAGAGILANYRYSLDGGAFDVAFVFTNLTAGNHTVIARDLNLCESDPQVFSIGEPNPIALIEAHTNESPCSYNNNGTIVLAASGGSGTGYHYSIDGGNDFSNTTGNFNNLIAGTYKCLAHDDQNCESDTTTIVITQPVPIDFNADVTNVTPCFGGSNGQIQVNASGGTAPYRFSRVPGVYVDNGGLFTGLSAANYTIRVQDAGGCLSNPQTVPVSQPGQLTFSETHTDPLCHNDANGTITISALGGSGSFEFSLTDGATWPYSNGNITGLSANSYTVKVRDVPSHCESTSQVVSLNNPTSLVITMPITFTDATFNGGADGTITINVSGGQGNPYDFSIDGGGTFPYTGNSPYIISGLEADTYPIIVADANSCVANGGNVTISEPGQLTIVSIVPTSPGCFDANTGSITITTSGGSGTIKYSIDGGAHYSPDLPNDHVYTFLNKHSGVYHIMVQDNVITVDGGNVSISDPTQLVIDSQIKTNITCNNANDGTIHIVASGGTGDLTYQCPTKPSQINNGLFTNLAQAQYTITVTDANGCFVQSNKHTVINPPLLVIQSVNNTQISCNGANDGSITVAVSGGTPETGSQYHFSLDGGATSVQGTSPYTFNNLIPGNYNVVVWDKNTCTKIYTVNPVAINEPPAIIISDVSHTDVLCFGLSTGSITITASGGTPFAGNEFEFSINGGINYSKGTSPFTFANQAAGNFAVVVRDALGCTLSGGTEVIAQPVSAISVSNISWSPDPVLCNGDLVTLTITATGGTGALQYSINNGTNYFNNGGVFIDISAGTYHIKVKDNNNCELDHGIINIPQPNAIAITNIDQVNVKCFGESTGSITISANGGTGILQYSINGGVNYFANNGLFTSLDARTYNIRIKDANNCILVGPAITLTEPDNPLVINSAVPTHITTCAGNAEGQIAITASGGTPIGGTQYKFSKDGGLNYITSTSPYSFTALLAGPYHIMIMDANDCVTDGGTITINEPAAIVINNVVPVSPLCHGGSTGTISIFAVGGTGLKLYSIKEPANYVDNGGVFTGLAAGVYHIRVQDANSCISDGGVFNLADPDALHISIVDSLLSCGSLPILEADTTFLPDGSGVSYVSTIHHTDFDPGQTVLNANDIESICINIEHSYAQDLTMVLTCPDGKSVTLIDQDAGGSFVGKPIKDESDFSFPEINVESGEGFSYCFTQSATETWTSVYGDSTYTYTDLGGFPHVNKIYVPSGVYRPKQNISNLVGCPLNGDWTITVTDNYLGDNGYLFSWGLNFNPSAFPEGYCNGMVDIGVEGGTPNYSFEWSNGRTTAKITDLCAGDYTVTVTDANGCQANYTTTVEDVDLQLVVDNVSHVTCQGMNNGSINLQMTGGNQPYSYVWETGATTPNISNLEAGVYSFTITDFNLCEYIDSIEINYQFSITTSMADTALVSCNSLTQGPHTGTATVVVTATEPITYEWTNGETNATATQLPAGWNFVTVTDANLCPAVDSIFMNQPAELTAIALLTEPLCNGNSNGSVAVTGSGGNAPYSILWEDNSSDNPRNLLASGNYAFTLTDANNCFINQPVNLTEPTVLGTSVNSTPTGCGVSTGTAQVLATGGTPVYSYLWSNGSITDQATALGVGMHYVTVTDFNGCVKTDSVLIQNDTDLAISGYTVASPVLCNGDCNGSLVVNLTGGAGPYTYAWSNGVNNDTTINLCANTDYSVTVTDANNCVVFGTTQITEPIVLNLTIISPVQVSCMGGSNGSAVANPIGGTGPYTFDWRNALNVQVSNQLSATGLSAGTYSLTVTDAHLCTATTSVTISEPATAVSATHTIVPATCSNTDGSAEVNPAGGVAPYTYLWSNGAGTDSVATGLSVNIYYVTVYDANSCQYIDTINITDNSTLTLTVDTIIDVSCFGLCNGSATVKAESGSRPYSYIWSSGAIDSIATNLCAINHTVSVTDMNGCSRTISITVEQPDPVIPLITSNPLILCAGQPSGTATVDVNGGVSPYQYEWRDNSGVLVNTVTSDDTSTTINSVTAGTYSLLIVDANSCIQNSFDVTIAEIAGMQLGFANNNASCGQPDGSSVVTVNGGTSPYTYAWSDLVTNTDTLENVPAGTYFVTITDQNLCQAVGSTTLFNNSNLVVDSVQLVQKVSCNSGCDGVIRVHVSGGTNPMNYQWNTGHGSHTLPNVCGGQTYTVIITDANQCSVTYNYTVPHPDTLTVQASVVSDVLCYGNTTGAAIATPGGGTANYSYSWLNNVNQEISTVFNPTFLAAGQYVVVLTDQNGCHATDTINILQPATALSATTSLSPSTCFLPTGRAAIIPSGGTPFNGTHPYTYLWEFDNSTDSLHIGLGVAIYSVIVTDSNNCQIAVQFEMEDDSDLEVVIDSVKNISCVGNCDGKAWAKVTGGSGNMAYIWSNGDALNVADELCSGPIWVTVTDESGCKDITSSSIQEPAPFSVLENVNDVLCAGQSTGSASISISGGWVPYNVNWEDTEGNIIPSTLIANSSTVSGLAEGMYFYTIHDAGSCTYTGDITIQQPDPLDVNFDIVNADCEMENGSIEAIINGGVGPYSIRWSNINWPSEITNVTQITDIPAGIYYFNLTDGNGCTFSDVVIMNNPTAPEIDAVLTHNVSCLERCDGAAIANILVESTGNYSFEWSNGETTQEAISLCAQYYEVFAQDLNRCRSFDHITLSNDEVLQISFNQTEPSCYGSNDGEIAVTPLFGSGPPFTYNWEEGQTDSLISGLSAGWYYVTVSDASNCRVEGSVLLGQPDSIFINIVINSPIICSGDNSGNITVHPSGGTRPYYVSLYDNQMQLADSAFVTDSIIFNNLNSQNYTIRVYDTLLCIRDFAFELPNPDPIRFTFTTTRTECTDSTGSAKVVVTGGNPPYTYNWFTLNEPDSILSGYDTDSIWDLPVNFYILEVTDSIGCFASDTVEIKDVSEIDFFYTILNHPTCEGVCNGSAYVHDISGGTPAYTYRWENLSGFETTDTAYQLCLGANQVFVIDAEGCRKVKTVNMLNSNILRNYFISLNDISNIDEICNGYAASVPMGGIPPYSFLWSDENHTTDSVIYELCEGTYYLTLTDNTGCQIIDSILITKDPFRWEMVELKQPSCYSGNDGSIEILAKGGYPGGYQYKWAYETWASYPAHDSITPKITNLEAGWYYFTLTDAGNGVITDSIELGQPIPVVPHYVITRTECDVPTGTIMVNIESGGTAPFNFAWAFNEWSSFPMPDSIGSSLQDLGVGIYYITVTDNKNCQYLDSVEMNDTSPFRINAVVTPARCYNWSTGQITIIPSNGQAPYDFNWQHDSNATNVVSGLHANTYYVTVTDGDLCVRDSAILVSQPDSIQFQLADTVPITCHDSCTGKITVANVQGGNGSNTFLLKQGSVQVNVSGFEVLSNICEGNYLIQVRDQLGCLSADVPYSITAPSALSASFTKVFAACNFRDSSGLLIANISGGTPFVGDQATAYKYLWANGDTTNMADNLPSGYFNLHVEDSMGCPKDTLVFLDANINIYPSAEIFNFNLKDTTICYGDSIQLLGTSNILSGSSSMEPDSAVWFPGRSPIYNLKVAPHDTTRYSYIVYKANCYNFDTVLIRVYPELQIDAGDYPLTFVGTEIHLLATANTEFDSVQWIGTDYALNPNTYTMSGLDTFITPQDSLWLFVTAYKYNGLCFDRDSTKIRIYQELDPPSGFTPNGDGINDTWLIPGIMEFTNVEVKIFNRWGEMVYEVKGRYLPWEGKNKKGKQLPIGTYYYIIDLHDGKTKPVSGPVTIIR